MAFWLLEYENIIGGISIFDEKYAKNLSYEGIAPWIIQIQKGGGLLGISAKILNPE